MQQLLLLREQERLVTELDRQVTERTREIAEANKDLQIHAGLLQHLPVSAWTLKPDGTPDFVIKFWLDFAGQPSISCAPIPRLGWPSVHPDDREAAVRRFGTASAQDRVLRLKPALYERRMGSIAGICSKPWSCATRKGKP